MNPDKLVELAARVDGLKNGDNALDVLITLALFEPDEDVAAVRANSAGTKVIYTDHAGRDETCWAYDWTRYPANTARLLRARARAHAQGSKT